MEPLFNISESAFKKLLSMQENSNQFLRISVLSGGCSGFQYKLDTETSIQEDDKTIKRGPVTIVIDSVSYPFLENSTLTYETELIGSYFKITNPNADQSCGCGASFSV